MIVKTAAEWLTTKFSYTKLKCYSQCARKAFLTYVVKRKEPASQWLLIGRASHEGLEYDAYSKMRGENLPLKEIRDFAVSALEEDRAKEGVPEQDCSTDAFVKDYDRQLEVFETTGERARINPVPGTVESAFQLELSVGEPDGPKKPIVLEGYTDLVSLEDGERVAVDFKTAGRKTSDREAEEHIQLHLEAYGAESPKARINTFVRSGKQKATMGVTKNVTITLGRIERTLRFVADNAHAFIESVRTGLWPKTNPDLPHCRVCQHRSLCFPDREPQLQKWVTVEKIIPAGQLPPQEWRMSKAGKREMERSAK